MALIDQPIPIGALGDSGNWAPVDLDNLDVDIPDDVPKSRLTSDGCPYQAYFGVVAPTRPLRYVLWRT